MFLTGLMNFKMKAKNLKIASFPFESCIRCHSLIKKMDAPLTRPIKLHISSMYMLGNTCPRWLLTWLFTRACHSLNECFAYAWNRLKHASIQIYQAHLVCRECAYRSIRVLVIHNKEAKSQFQWVAFQSKSRRITYQDIKFVEYLFWIYELECHQIIQWNLLTSKHQIRFKRIQQG